MLYTTVFNMKDFEFAEYYDVYGALLTEHQQKLIEGYYLYDLSLSELAEEFGGTRQSVYDAIKKARVILLEYESKLNLCEKNKKLLEIINEVKTVSEDLATKLENAVRG